MTLSSARALAVVAAVCLLVQLASATIQVRDFTTPNASTKIARNVVATGQYVLIGGPEGSHATTPRRAFQLPGEPLYLAAGFLIVPAALQRYLHVPVTLLFVMAISVIALVMGGERLALITGLIACLDPFLVAHGPVWDDTFMAAACEWIIFATLLMTLRAVSENKRQSRLATVVLVVIVACVTGWAGLTRLQSQIVLGLAGLGLLTIPSFRVIRWLGGALLGGLALALGVWGTRNLLVLGAFLVGSTHDGQTLYQSVHGNARQSIIQTGVAQTLLVLPTQPWVGELEEDRDFTQQAWAYARTHPADVLTTAAFKTGVSLSGYDFTAALWSARNVAAVGSNVLFLVAAPWGWWHWRRQARPSRTKGLVIFLGSLTALTTCGLLAIGPVGMRYRTSLSGFLYLGTGLTALLLRGKSCQAGTICRDGMVPR